MSSCFTKTKLVFFFALTLILVLSMSSQNMSTQADKRNTAPLLYTPPALLGSTSGDVYDGTGDWVITQPTVYTDNLSLVVNGDVLIEDGGSLTLENSVINFNVTGSLLNVSDGGYLVGIDSYLQSEGGGTVVEAQYTAMFYGNVSWTGGYIWHFDEVIINNSTLNATFVNCDFAYSSGQLSIQRAHAVSFTGCSFYEIDCSHDYLIDTSGGSFSFPGHIMIEECRFGSDSQAPPSVSEGIAYGLNYAGDFKLLSSLFYEVNSPTGYLVHISYVSDNSTVSRNRFIRCGSSPVSIFDHGCVVSENKFFSNNIGLFTDQHIIEMACNDTIVEKNLLWNNTVDSDIRIYDGNNTIRWNTIIDSARIAIELQQNEDGSVIHGNALYSNSLGLSIHEDADGQQIYLNAFIDNDQHAEDGDGDDPINWDNGTHGNYWSNYTGTDSDNDWVGETSFSPHVNITDDYPSFMIGELPRSSGNWVTDIPNLFSVNDLTINGDVEVDGPTGSILLISNVLSCGQGNSFSFGESSVLWLQDAEITTTNPSDEMGDFHFNDIFYFGVMASSISNIHSQSGQNDFTITSRFIDFNNNTVSNIPAIRVSLHSDYVSSEEDWEPFGKLRFENNIINDLKSIGTDNAIQIDWPNFTFKNNSIECKTSGEKVELYSDYQTDHPYDLYIIAQDCTVVNASLNITAIGDAIANITDCGVDEGIIAYSRFNAITDTDVFMSGNTINSGGIQAGGLMWGSTECYAHLVLNDNIIIGTTDLNRLSSGTADNNTFNGALLLEDSSSCTFTGSTINSGIDFDGPLNDITFEDTSFLSSGFIDIGSTGGNCHYLTFDNCTFDGVTWLLTSNCRFVKVTECTFFTGIDITNQIVHNVTIENSFFRLAGGTAIAVDGNNATVVGNTIVNASDAIKIIDNLSECKNPVVSGNTIENITGLGIRVTTYESKVVLDGNRISNCSSYGIRADGLSNYSIVKDNYVQSAGSYGMQISSQLGEYSYYSNITHNIVESCGGNGITLIGIRNSRVYNNTMILNAGFGFDSDGCSGTTFWLNFLYENDEGNIDRTGGMTFDNGTYGNFWGPSGSRRTEYCDSYDTGGNPWIGDVSYQLDTGIYDNYPLLHNQLEFLNYPNTIETHFIIGFRFIVLNTTVYPQEDMWIWSDGNCTLIGTTIEFQSDSSTVQPIIIEDGGELRLLAGATITANQTDATYGFVLRTGSSLVIYNSSIRRCGYGAGNPGFIINITSVSFNHLRVYESKLGMELNQIGLEISNVSFYDCDVGLRIQGCTLCNISHLFFDNVGSGIQLNSSTDCHIFRNNFTGCVAFGLVLDSSSDNNLIEDNIFAEIEGVALYIASNGNDVLYNAFIENTYHIEEVGTLSNTYDDGTHGNFYFDFDGGDDDGDLVGDTPYSSAISDITNNCPMMVYGNQPTPTGWIVNRTTIALDTNYTITGDTEVYSTLLMFNTRLWINCSSLNEYSVNIHVGGNITAHGAILMAVNSSYKFGMSSAAGSAVSLYGVNLIGLFRYESFTTNIVLLNTTFTDIQDGLRLSGSGGRDLVLENCTVYNATQYALYIGFHSNITVRDWVFYSVDEAIRVRGEDVTIENIIVYTCNDGVYYDQATGTLNILNSDFYNARTVIGGHTAENILVDGCNAYNVTVNGVFCYYVQNATIRNIHFEMFDTGQSFTIDETDWYLISESYASNGSNGITIDDLSNGTIENCEFYYFTRGIKLESTFQTRELNVTGTLFYDCDTGFIGDSFAIVLLEKNTFRFCGIAINAVDLHGSSIIDNEFYDCDNGFYSSDGALFDCTIVGNLYSNVDYPIVLNAESSSAQYDITIANETMISCIDGIKLDGYEWIENITILNTTITSASGNGVYIDHCRNISLSNMTLDSFTYGLYLVTVEDIYLNESILTNGDWAIHLDEPSLIMRDCSIADMISGAFEYTDLWYGSDLKLDIDTSNTLEGLPIYCYFNISDAVVSSHETYSLAVIKSSNVTVVGFEVNGTDDFLVFDSVNITVSNSTINTNIAMVGDDYLFTGNTFNNVTIDFIETTENATFTLNAFLIDYDFIGEWQVTHFSLNGTEYGNYWYDYTGTDENDDGIGDDPFSVTSAGETDYLPLMTDPLEYTVIITIYSPEDNELLNGLANVSVIIEIETGFYYEGSISVLTIITLNGTQIGSGGEGQIEFDLNTTEHSDGLYTLNVTATVNSVNDFTESIVIIIDNTGPVLEPSIEDGTATSNSNPSWRVDATDDISNLLWIAVYLDGTLVKNESASGQTDYMLYNLALSDERSYILCHRSMDEVGNLGEVNITIYYDETVPQISSPDDFEYEVDTTGHTVTWVVSELTPSHYNVTLNGEPWINSDWNGSNIIINVDGLDVGINTISITVNDRVGYYSTDSLQVTVTEPPAPEINHPSDIEYSEGSTGSSIVWTPTDSNPDSYRILRNGTELESGDWDGSTIEIDVDGLSLGVYNYTLIVNNTKGVSVSDIVFVTVYDGTPPTIDHPDDFSYNAEETGNVIEWNPEDSHPDNFEIYRNGTTVKSGLWNSTEETITISVDGLGSGTHNFTILVVDIGGNTVSDQVMVLVISDTTVPSINHPTDIVYTEGATGFLIAWTPYDDHPSEYEVFRNGTLIESGDWNSSTETIQISVDGLDVGTWNYTVRVVDTSGNAVTDQVFVTVQPSTTMTSPTTTTPTTGTTTTPTDGGFIVLIFIIVAGVAVVVTIVIVIMRKKS